MEETHRLKPMPANYDKAMFNRIFAATEGLRRKLASQIDHRRFGLPYEDVLSAFNVKFIYTFSKYHEKPEELCKAYCIRAMQNFKCRAIKSAYLEKNSQSIISTDDAVIEEKAESEQPDYYYEKLMTFMKAHLSENAYCLLDLQLNPPPYILTKINPSPEGNLRQQKIPDEVILDYFDLGHSPKAYKYLVDLKKEIRNTVNYAKQALNN